MRKLNDILFALFLALGIVAACTQPTLDPAEAELQVEVADLEASLVELRASLPELRADPSDEWYAALEALEAQVAEMNDRAHSLDHARPAEALVIQGDLETEVDDVERAIEELRDAVE